MFRHNKPRGRLKICRDPTKAPLVYHIAISPAFDLLGETCRILMGGDDSSGYEKENGDRHCTSP